MGSISIEPVLEPEEWKCFRENWMRGEDSEGPRAGGDVELLVLAR